MTVSAYIPCHNNAANLGQAIESLQLQTVGLKEILVIDDGSWDESASIAERVGARVIRHVNCLGRGAARARAFSEVSGDLVLGLDASCTIERNFVERASVWLQDACVAGAFARLAGPPPRNAVERWRSRHLYQDSRFEASTVKPEFDALLVTACSLLRRDAVLNVGNFNAQLRHTEDGELGRRLLSANWKVVAAPELRVIVNKRETLGTVLERYWRWHAGVEPKASITSWLRMSLYATKVMIARDLREGDPLAAAISLWVPHDQLLRTLLHGFAVQRSLR